MTEPNAPKRVKAWHDRWCQVSGIQWTLDYRMIEHWHRTFQEFAPAILPDDPAEFKAEKKQQATDLGDYLRDVVARSKKYSNEDMLRPHNVFNSDSIRFFFDKAKSKRWKQIRTPANASVEVRRLVCSVKLPEPVKLSEDEIKAEQIRHANAFAVMRAQCEL